MSDRFGFCSAHGVVAVAVVMLMAGCNGETVDGPDAAASPSPTDASPPAEGMASPSPTPTPTETPTGPDDDGWAEHLGLTEEELEQRRASDDFLEFAKPRRAREHPRFSATHGNLGLRPVPGDGLDVQEGQGVSALNLPALAASFVLPFRDTLLAEGLIPVEADEVPGSDGSYVSRAHRQSADERQVFVVVAFYEGDAGEARGRVGMAAADVNVVDPDRNHVELTVVEFEAHVADAAAGDDWSETWRGELVDEARAWGEPRELE